MRSIILPKNTGNSMVNVESLLQNTEYMKLKLKIFWLQTLLLPFSTAYWKTHLDHSVFAVQKVPSALTQVSADILKQLMGKKNFFQKLLIATENIFKAADQPAVPAPSQRQTQFICHVSTIFLLFIQCN